ncbi:MAG: DUF4347 domain-containing protein, partial [Pseudomonadota bacterium]
VLATIDGEAMALGSDSFLSDASMNDDGSLATLVGDVLGEGGEVRLHGGGEGANADIEQSAVEQLSILTGVPVTIGSGNGGDPAATPEGADESAADGVEGPVLTDTLETAQDYKFLIATDIRHQSVSAPSLAFSAPSSTASDDARADLLETVDQPESAPDAELETRLSDRQPDMTPVFLTARDTNAGANDGVTGDILIDPGLVAPIATLTAPALQSQTQSPLQSQAQSQSQSQSQSQIPARDPQDEFGDLIAAAADGVAQGRTEIVFVDTSVNGYQTLVDGLPENVEVVLIGRDVDGVEQIAAYLDGRTDVDAIHIISHGDVGNVSLGTADLNKESITGAYADELAIINAALSDNADLLIYGCNFGADAEAVRLLAEATGADIAASDNLTGAALLGAAILTFGLVPQTWSFVLGAWALAGIGYSAILTPAGR